MKSGARCGLGEGSKGFTKVVSNWLEMARDDRKSHHKTSLKHAKYRIWVIILLVKGLWPVLLVSDGDHQEQRGVFFLESAQLDLR